MKRMAWFLAAAVLAAPWAFAQADTACGVVFNDSNGNGLRDPGERGLSGVAVSNGEAVVETGRRGEYALPVTDDTVLFVLKPSGWRVPVPPGKTSAPFYYVHNPKGSPKMKYPGVAPTGPLPASVDFPLQRARESAKFRVACLGDTQTRDVEEVRFLTHDILEDLRGEGAVFGVSLGDNAFNDLTVFEPLAEAMRGAGFPWRPIIGNHDHHHDAPSADSDNDAFERVFGPAYHAFDYGRVHFIALDDICQDVGREDYHAELGARQMAFVRADLARVDPRRLVVLLMHIPIMEIRESRELYELLGRFPHTFSISGHTHSQRHVFLNAAGRTHHHLVHATACGSWWGGNFDDAGIPSAQMSDGTPNGYSIITFDGVKYDVAFRAARRPADCQMSLWTPEEVPAAGPADAVANVFAGSEKSIVEMRVDGAKAWTPMAPFKGKDPYFLEASARQAAFIAALAELRGEANPDKRFISEMRGRFKAVLRGLPEPGVSAHLWKAALPAGLAPGPHTLTVRTTDLFGHTYTGTRLFIVK